MSNTICKTLIAALLFGVTAVSAESEEVPLEQQPHPLQISVWMKQAAEAYDQEDYEAWAEATEQLRRLRPHNQDFMTHLVKAYSQTGNLSKAFNTMLLMQQQGLAQDWDEIDEVEPLREHNLYNHLNDLMVEAGQPFGEAEVYSVLGQDVHMPEAIARDSESGRLFIGSVRDGRILVTEDGEEWQEFASPENNDELMAVMSLVADPERGHLWVATGAVSQYEGYRSADRGRTSLLKLDLETGELLAAHRVIPDRQPRLLGSLALAPDGTVYAADSISPTLFKLEPDGDRPRPFFTHRNLSSLRGLAVSDDNERLYVADYEVGIFVVGLGDEDETWKLAVPEHLNEGGIDGLMLWDGHLVAIQNGISPQRVMRMTLGDDGLGVTDLAPVVASQPEFDIPTFGVIDDNHLYFLAGSHWHHVNSRGRAGSGGAPPVHVMKTDVEETTVHVVGQEKIEEILRQRAQ